MIHQTFLSVTNLHDNFKTAYRLDKKECQMEKA